jgi:hopanoid-associated phosphorylase
VLRSAERIGIVVALPAEARSLDAGDAEIGDVIDLGVAWLMLSGIGGGAAEVAAERLISHGATRLLCWGTAGGLDPLLDSGALIVPGRIADASNGIRVDPVWHRSLVERLSAQLPVSTAPLFATDRPLATRQEKFAAFVRYGAAAVDMESGAVGGVAARHARPFAVVRAIVDPAMLTLPPAALTSIDAHGRTSLWRVTKSLIARPSDLLPLIDLGRRFALALKTLTCAAGIVLEPAERLAV